MDTVTVETSKLIDHALDWAAAKCEGAKAAPIKSGGPVHLFLKIGFSPLPYCPSTNWAQGGPIIERESIDTFTEKKSYPDSWLASVARYQNAKKLVGWRIHQYGPTPLIAAMRCYVASKLGDTVQIPRELVP